MGRNLLPVALRRKIKTGFLFPSIQNEAVEMGNGGYGKKRRKEEGKKLKAKTAEMWAN
jgi:hypothetical protein